MDSEEGVRNGADIFGTFTGAKRLTVDEVLQTKGFEHLTEDEARRYIDDLERLCLLMYQHFSRTKTGNYGCKRKAA
jgi:hypothetical protein